MQIEVLEPGAEKSCSEKFLDIMYLETKPGDTIKIKIIWGTNDKAPRLLAQFSQGNTNKWVEFSKLFPEQLRKINPKSGVLEGPLNWREYLLDRTRGLLTFIETSIKSSGRVLIAIEERAH